MRAGIHTGPIIAGVVGQQQYLIDVWGDTLNTAVRVEGLGTPNAVTISGQAWQHVSNLCHSTECREVKVKGKGDLGIYRVDGLI